MAGHNHAHGVPATRRYAVHSRTCGHVVKALREREDATSLVELLAEAGHRQFRVRVATSEDLQDAQRTHRCDGCAAARALEQASVS